MRLLYIFSYRNPILYALFIHLIFFIILSVNWSSYSNEFLYKKKFKSLDASLIFVELKESNKDLSQNKKKIKTNQNQNPRNIKNSEFLKEKIQSKIQPKIQPKITDERSYNSKNFNKKTSIDKEKTENKTNELVKYYASLVSQQMKMRWSLPSSAKKNMVSEVKIRVLPSGDVTTIELSLSSGDKAFDQSTLLAVKKAGRFKFMKDIPRDIFESHFREFIFRFSPEDL